MVFESVRPGQVTVTAYDTVGCTVLERFVRVQSGRDAFEDNERTAFLGQAADMVAP